MTKREPPIQIETTPQERQVAALIHAAALFFPFAGPLVGLILSGRSKYARYHAVQSLLVQCAIVATLALLVILSLAHSIYTAWRSYTEGADINWWLVILKPAVIWISSLIFGLINTIGEFFQIFAAYRGTDWGRQNPVHRLARKFAGISTA